MNINETTQALALAQAFDNRTVGEVNIRAWFSVLFDADAADVMAAIRDHYAGTTEWIMPAHIRAAVRGMVSQREAAARMTGWAPGQAGVPKDQAMPEVTIRDRMALSDLPAAVADLVARVRTTLPEGSREALMPRRVAWEREHKAFLRTQDGEPNPLYKPRGGEEGTRCFKTEPHGRHNWKIDSDEFSCLGTFNATDRADYYDTQATAGTHDPDPTA